MEQEKNNKESEKHPMDMTTDEALDYVFGPELADELKKEVALCNNDEPSDSDN
jgi:hypothetical protein